MATSFSYTLGTTAVVSVVDSSDGEIVPIADMCADGLSVLIKQYAESPRLQAFICALLDPLQEAEDAINDALTIVLDVNVAEGVNLDLIGAIVGEPRQGRDDDDYRLVLKVRIRVNRSDGKFSDFYRILALWDPDGTGQTVRDFAPAYVEIRANDTTNPATLNEMLQQAKAAGVRLISFWQEEDASFRFANSYASGDESTTTEGFGSSYGPTPGGDWAAAFE